MYSPLARPSSTRAAPAKNRIWSTIGGISSDIVRPIGLPVFSDSMATRSVGVLLDHVRELEQRALPLARRRPAPLLERRAGSPAGLVDVDGRGVRRARIDLAGRRVDDVHHGAVGRRLDLAVDDVVERLLLRHWRTPSTRDGFGYLTYPIGTTVGVSGGFSLTYCDRMPSMYCLQRSVRPSAVCIRPLVTRTPRSAPLKR